MKAIHSLVAKVRGKNHASMPVGILLDQMNEPRPLPLGVKEFEAWSDRIIAGAMLPAEPKSLKFALAEMVMHLKPTEDHVADGYFIKCLRKAAANQVCYAQMEAIRNERKLALAKAEETSQEAK